MRSKIKIGKTYQSNSSGNFRVTAYLNARNISIEFLDTGYKTTSTTSHIIEGSIKDLLKPILYGIGFIGDGSHVATKGGIMTKSYRAWSNMLRRCYHDKTLEKNPCYKGCEVSPKWHNYQDFAGWFDVNYIDGYHLDKDILIDGNKIYSPGFCMFVSQKENNIKAAAKSYKFTSPSGEDYEVYNLSEFCRYNNLCNSNMSRVHLGKLPHHKGWLKTKREDWYTRYCFEMECNGEIPLPRP